MENPPSDNQTPDTSSVPPPVDGELHHDDAVATEILDHQHPGAEQKTEISEDDEITNTLQGIASTGKFWHDWEKLKGEISCWLNKVLSEYPEAKMTEEQQKEALLGETYSELVTRLDQALCSFDEGPPFTLQRLCEILLSARSIYPKLSKLALALEKNLEVTSMLSKSTASQSQITDETSVIPEDTKTTSENWAPNGTEVVGGDKDEIMTEVEEADVDDAMTIDMEPINEPSETMTITTSESEETPSGDTATKPASDSMNAEEGESPLP